MNLNASHIPSNYIIPREGFMRLSAILQVIPIGKTTWWEGVKRGRFPKPVKLSSNVTAWHAEDIRNLIASYGNKVASN